jgi:hypothetical protein
MSRDGRRFGRANAATVLALALVAFFAMALRVSTEKQQPSVEEVGELLPVAKLDTESRSGRFHS